MRGSINLGSVDQEVNNTVRVTVFVIVPRNELDEVGVKSNTGSSIENGGFSATDEISRDNGIFSVAEDTLQFGFGGSLDNFLDFIIRSSLMNQFSISVSLMLLV